MSDPVDRRLMLGGRAADAQRLPPPSPVDCGRVENGKVVFPDIWLCLINTARFLTGEEPASVFAERYSPPGNPRCAEVEETVAFTLRFPSNTIVQCLTSYGARDDKAQTLNCAPRSRCPRHTSIGASRCPSRRTPAIWTNASR